MLAFATYLKESCPYFKYWREMPKAVEDVCQLQNLIQVSFLKRILSWRGEIFKKSLLKIFRVGKSKDVSEWEYKHYFNPGLTFQSKLDLLGLCFTVSDQYAWSMYTILIVLLNIFYWKWAKHFSTTPLWLKNKSMLQILMTASILMVRDIESPPYQINHRVYCYYILKSETSLYIMLPHQKTNKQKIIDTHKTKPLC